MEIAVADTGVGIRRALLTQYEHIADDLEAVKLALLPHVSGTFGQSGYSSMSDNAGLGLFFIKEIVSRGLGGLFLGSGQGLVDVWGKEDGTEGKLYVRSRQRGWPGTFAVLQFRRGGIIDFGSLLELCRDLAAVSRRESGRIPLRFLEQPPTGTDARVIKVQDFAENVELAAKLRDEVVLPELVAGRDVVLDFTGVRVPTQSFAHACLYKLLRDVEGVFEHLTIAGATNGAKQVILTVASYARAR
ncbi:MAG: STAS-like domain-containing protein [Candidatus Riflebacteria bacterium]|nr:STAS-like domain-containing protein [Candidatus Riflebacteria bacterium]